MVPGVRLSQVVTLSNSVFNGSNFNAMNINGTLISLGDTEVSGTGLSTFSNAAVNIGASTPLNVASSINTSNLIVQGMAVTSNLGICCYPSVSLDVNGSARINGDFAIYPVGQTILSNSATFASNVHVSGAGVVTFSNVGGVQLGDSTPLYTAGILTSSNNVTFASNLTVLGTLKTYSTDYLYSNVTIYNSELLMSNLSVNGKMDVTGVMRLNSSNSYNNKGLVLWDGNSNDTVASATAFFGLGVNSNILRYQTNTVNDTHAFFSGVTEQMRVGSNVGIGTSTPSYKLHVAGTIYATGDITAFSDQRSKTDIQKVENAIDKLNQIGGYTFTRTIDDTAGADAAYRRYAGVLAQEVRSVLPEAVYEDEHGNLSVAYGNLAALFVEGLKELGTKVVALQAENVEIRRELQNLFLAAKASV